MLYFIHSKHSHKLMYPRHRDNHMTSLNIACMLGGECPGCLALALVGLDAISIITPSYVFRPAVTVESYEFPDTSCRMVAPYRHTLLTSAESIRVIYLQPSTDFWSPLSCSLAVLELAQYTERQDAQYTALSYSWDAQTPDREVYCDGNTLLVTANCEAALRRLRLSDTTQQLWIDSICINQNSDTEAIEERNHQVALMGQIYKKAKRVVVWVGEKDEKTQHAINVVRDLGHIPGQNDNRDRREVQRQIQERVQSLKSRVTKPADDPITPLFDRSWFHRMWTIQEVTLCAPNKIVLMCGDIELPWLNMIIATDALGNNKYPWSRWNEAMSLQKALTMFLIMHRYPGAKQILDDNPGDLHNSPLAFNILVQAREKKSSDPKDKIFALYSILQELEVPLPAPDYKKSIEEIYREATIAAITYDKSLYMLYYAPSDNRRGDLASWVPDWSDAGWKQADPRYALLRDRFAACGPAESMYRFSPDKKQLIVQGRIVDNIIYRTEPLPPANAVYAQMRDRNINPVVFYQYIYAAINILRSWVEVSQWCGDQYITGERTLDALQRTLVADEPRNNADALAGGAFQSWYKFITSDDNDIPNQLFANNQSGLLGGAMSFLGRALDGVVPEPQRTFIRLKSSGQAFKFQTLVMPFMEKKCFFYTEKGYFGTMADPLPVSVADGDVVAVVGGLGMPLVLRPFDGGYRLICHAYVHGMMHGEAWPEDGSMLEDIVLL